MLIGIDGSRAFVEGRTGTENYSYQLIKNLSHIDTENKDRAQTSAEETLPRLRRTLRFADAKRQYLIYLRPGQDPQGDWPDNFRFKVLDYPRFWTQIGLSRATFEDNLDVLFVPSHTLPLIRKPGLKTVLTVHDLGAEFLPASHQLKQILYLKLMTHYQLKTATKLIAVSEATKKDIIKRVGVEPKRIEVVYEGVEKSMFRSIHSDTLNNIVKKFDIVRGKYFLFVGTIQPRKNLERLIEAFSIFLSEADSETEHESSISYLVSGKKNNSKYKIQNTEYKLVLVGGKGWKSEAIYELPKGLGIEKQVKFLGRVSDEDLPALYRGAAALTYPSLFEGFGLPIIEAFASCCPVITSNVSSMPEVAGDAALKVDPYNIVAISNAMREVVKNDTLRSSMIKKGIIRSDYFDWKKAAESTVKILTEAGR